MKATLSLTHRCNLACRYCYSGRGSRPDMSADTAGRIVDFVLDLTPPDGRAEFCFFGGEPLLCLELMRTTTRYIRERAVATGKQASVSVTTNGTLLRPAVLDFLEREHLNVCVSIDGPADVHDLNRCYSDGRGSFARVLEGLLRAVERLDDVQANAVYGPDTLSHLPQIIPFFAGLGVSAIHLNPDICADWNEESCLALAEAYMQVAHAYIECYRRGQQLAVNLIDSKVILFVKGGYAAGDTCGMGETEWGFAPSGNIYPCERLIGEDEDPSLCLGNVHTGLDLARRCAVLKARGNRNEECQACALRKYCMNWCGCTNYYMTGHTDLAGPMLCASEKAAMQAARHVLTTLQGDELFIGHLLGYVRGVSPPRGGQDKDGKGNHVQDGDRVRRRDQGTAGTGGQADRAAYPHPG